MGCSNSAIATIRVGIVSSTNPKRNTVRVKFPDLVDGCGQPMVSYDYPIVERDTLGDRDYKMLDIDTQVLCLCLGNGLENGFVIAATYNDKDEPPVNCQDKRHYVFKDGTTFEYDRAAHKLTADVKGDIDVKATGKIEMVATGDITISSIGGKVNINGREVHLNEES
jgi:phage baseplate assembly protein V